MKELNKITVLPGDGIGPEVITQAIKVLDAVKNKYEYDWRYCYADIGSIAIDNHGDPFPEVTEESCMNADAILLGAIGDPKYDNDPTAKIRPEQGLLKMRKTLGLFSNIRPVRVHSKLAHLSPVKEDRLNGVDFIIYRELTGGLYFGEKQREKDFASDLCLYTKKEIKRVAKQAFQMAQHRRKKLTLIDKANVLEASRLWREEVKKLSEKYPDVETNYLFVDNAAMQLIINPAQFDVVLCSNLFGDIISDEASVLVGSLGLLPSASRGKVHSLYEPVHGSYPQAAGKDIANPYAAILSVEMMLRDFGLTDEADTIQRAFDFCIEHEIGTKDLGGNFNLSCNLVGDAMSILIEEGLNKIRSDKFIQSFSTII